MENTGVFFTVSSDDIAKIWTKQITKLRGEVEKFEEKAKKSEQAETQLSSINNSMFPATATKQSKVYEKRAEQARNDIERLEFALAHVAKENFRLSSRDLEKLFIESPLMFSYLPSLMGSGSPCDD